MKYNYLLLNNNCETIKYKLLDDTKKKKIYKGIGRSYRPLSIINYSIKINNKNL